MKNISSTLTYLVLAILFISVIYIIIFLFILNITGKDAMMINNSIILKGCIQRVVKLELQKERSEDLIKETDKKLIEVNFFKKNISIFGRDRNDFQTQIVYINNNWNKLKNFIQDYRIDPNEGNSKLILRQSETLWEECNYLTFLIEKYSKNKIVYFYLILIVILINIFLLILIFYLIKKTVKDKLEYYAYYDYLTNCLNKRAFDETITKEIELAKRYNRIFSMISIDLDHFKKINDTYGHDIGDMVLRKVTKVIRDHIRSTDIFGRVGGEEFMIINFDNKLNEVKKFSEKIRILVQEVHFKEKFEVTASLGVTKFRGIKDTKEAVIRRADKALYKAKAAGRNRVVFDF